MEPELFIGFLGATGALPGRFINTLRVPLGETSVKIRSPQRSCCKFTVTSTCSTVSPAGALALSPKVKWSCKSNDALVES